MQHEEQAEHAEEIQRDGARADAERRFEKNDMGSIVVEVLLRDDEPPRRRRRWRPGDGRRRAPSLHRCLDHAYSSAVSATIDITAADGSRRTWPGTRDVRQQDGAADKRDDHDQRHVDEEDGPPPEVVEQQAADDRSECAAGAGEAGPDADGPTVARPAGRRWPGSTAWPASRMPPRPMSARAAMSWSALLAKVESRQPMPTTIRPSCKAPLRPNRSPRAPAGRSRPANTSL